MRLLIAEDDAGMRSVLERSLRQAGYVVDAFERGDDAEIALRTDTYDAAILDWALPGLTGPAICRRLRQHGDPVPVLIVTGRDAESDRVTGLDSGADDYLVKPFGIGELLARIRALLRRPSVGLAVPLHVGDLTVHPCRREAEVGDVRLRLTDREFHILERLAQVPGLVVPRPLLARSVLDDETGALGSNSLDVHICHIRRKLVAAHSCVEIATVRRVGFRLCPR